MHLLPSPVSRIATAPDGSLRVECVYEPHERTAAWENLRIVSFVDNRIVLSLPRYFFSEKVEFPEPGVVVIPLEGRFGQRHRLRVNVNAQTFMLDADEKEQPLVWLSQRLHAESPKQLLTYKPLRRRRNILAVVLTPIVVSLRWLRRF